MRKLFDLLKSSDPEESLFAVLMVLLHDGVWETAEDHWSDLVWINYESEPFRSTGTSVMMKRSEQGAMIGFTGIYKLHGRCAACMEYPAKTFAIMLRWLNGGQEHPERR